MRKLYLLIITALYPLISLAQPWHPVTVNTGNPMKQTTGGIEVTVTKSGNPGVGGSCNTITFPYHIGNGQPNSYTYSFSNTVNKVRLRFSDVSNGEEIRITYNGTNHYFVNSSMINNYAGSCVPNKPTGNGSGNITNTSSSNSDGEIIVSPAGGMNDITVAHLNGLTLGCFYDVFISLDTPVVFKYPFTDTMICAGGKFNLNYIVNSNFNAGNKFNVELSNSAGVFSNPAVVIGSVTSTATGVIPCTIPANTPSSDKYRIRIVSTNPVFTVVGTVPIQIDRFALPPFASQDNDTFCEGQVLNLETKYFVPGITVIWTGPSGFLSTLEKPVLPALHVGNTGDYYFEAAIGACRAYDTLHVEVFPNPPKPIFTSNAPLCEFDTLRIDVTDDTTGLLPIRYQWWGPNGFGDTSKNLVINNVQDEHRGEYQLWSTLGFCSVRNDTSADIRTKPDLLEVNSNSPIYPGMELKLFSDCPTPGVAYSWTGPDNFVSDQPDPVIEKAYLSAAGRYILTVTLDICSTTLPTTVLVTDPGKAVLSYYPNPVVNNQFTIKGITNEDKEMPFILLDLAGRTWMRETIPTDRRLVNETITVPGCLPNGQYFLKIRVDGEFEVVPITIMK